MKRMLPAALLLMLFALPSSAQEKLADGVLALCEGRYPGYAVAAYDGWGDETRGQYALVLSEGEDNILVIAEKAEGDAVYAFTVENTNAVREGSEIPSVLIDTGGDMLYYAYTDGDTKTTYSSIKQGGEWKDVGIIHQDFSHPEYDVDTLVSVRDGFLSYDRRKYDKLENPMDGSDLTQMMPLPVSPEFEENMRLAAFDVSAIDPTGWMFPVVPGVCDGLLEEGDTLLQLDVQSACILMLVRKEDGTKRLRIAGGWDEYKNGYAVEETGPVPEDASMDTFHMWDGVLFLGNDLCSFNFSLGTDGEWHLTSVQTSDSFNLAYNAVQSWEESTWRRNDYTTYGESPWNGDITQLDLLSLPRSYDEAVAQLDASSYMFVHNPNPADRLHLRAKPQKGAASLGKFYNRTPVYVMEEKGDWVHVRIGNETDGLEGYMMKQYLTTEDIPCAFPQKEILTNAYGEPVIPLQTQPKKNAPECAVIDGSSTKSWYIIGVAEEHWYVVMTSEGLVGYVLQGAFWDGNG